MSRSGRIVFMRMQMRTQVVIYVQKLFQENVSE